MPENDLQPSHVIKRDGRVLPFDAAKISAAIASCCVASAEFGADVAAQLCAQR
jgi:hypothetical protein